MGGFRRFLEAFSDDSPAFRPDDRYTSKARQRASKLQTQEIMTWLEAVTMGMSRALVDYRNDHDAVSLDELRDGAKQVIAFAEELEKRLQ